jgi:hypothetical protein
LKYREFPVSANGYGSSAYWESRYGGTSYRFPSANFFKMLSAAIFYSSFYKVPMTFCGEQIERAVCGVDCTSLLSKDGRYSMLYYVILFYLTSLLIPEKGFKNL